ncbi:helix-turn-helix transcriptional regulator [Pseudooceanicola sp. 502str34]
MARMTHTTPTELVVEARPLAYVSAKTLSALMDVSESTIWEWTRKGQLPKPRKMPSGATRWKWSEVETFLDTSANSPDGSDPILRASRGR